MKKLLNNAYGFTLLEVLVVIAVISVIAGGLILSLNPFGQLAKGRNSQRLTHVNAILNAAGKRISDNRGIWSCPAGSLPTSSAKIMASTGTEIYDIAGCLVPTYINPLPFDPSDSSAHYASINDYNSGYTIQQNATTGLITIAAPSAESNQDISATR